TDLGPDGRAALGLGRSFQDARLFPSMTVRQAIATALDRHVKVRDPIAAFLISPAVRSSERRVHEEVDKLIELLHLEAFADKFVGELSTGTRRIVDIACSPGHDPKVLLLDDPSVWTRTRAGQARAATQSEDEDEDGQKNHSTEDASEMKRLFVVIVIAGACLLGGAAAAKEPPAPTSAPATPAHTRPWARLAI